MLDSRRSREGKATLAEFQPSFQLLVAETAGGPKSCTTAEISCGGDCQVALSYLFVF